jgi:hypothetical protein
LALPGSDFPAFRDGANGLGEVAFAGESQSLWPLAASAAAAAQSGQDDSGERITAEGKSKQTFAAAIRTVVTYHNQIRGLAEG